MTFLPKTHSRSQISCYLEFTFYGDASSTLICAITNWLVVLVVFVVLKRASGSVVVLELQILECGLHDLVRGEFPSPLTGNYGPCDLFLQF